MVPAPLVAPLSGGWRAGGPAARQLPACSPPDPTAEHRARGLPPWQRRGSPRRGAAAGRASWGPVPQFPLLGVGVGGWQARRDVG